VKDGEATLLERCEELRMTIRSKHPLASRIFAPAVALLLIGAYVGSYLALLEVWFMAEEGMLGMASGHVEVDYSHGGQFAKVAFAPANWVDQKVRPALWHCRSTIEFGKLLGKP
jgi:hypothetical protein